MRPCAFCGLHIAGQAAFDPRVNYSNWPTISVLWEIHVECLIPALMEKLHMDHWQTIFDQINSPGWQKQVIALVTKLPGMPVPDSVNGSYAPSLLWNTGFRLSRDYLDSEIYELNGRRLDEEEFLFWMRIQYNL